ncbi:MAG: hypothetical protein WBW53_01180 [Terriglobales bacterium]
MPETICPGEKSMSLGPKAQLPLDCSSGQRAKGESAADSRMMGSTAILSPSQLVLRLLRK